MHAPFPINAALTAIVLVYKNALLIADEVAPRVPVGKQEFSYWSYPKGEAFTIPDTLVGRKGQPNEVEATATEVTASTQDYGLEDAVPQADIDNAPDNYDPLAASAQFLTNLILLDREKRVADLVFNDGNYAAANKITLTGADQWSDSTSDPIGAISAGLDACIMRPTDMVLGRAVYTKLSQHPQIVKAVNQNAGDAGLVRRQAIADLFELQAVHVGEGWVNTAKKGQTAVLSRVWGKHCVLFHKDPMANTQGGTTFALTAQWGARLAGNWEDKNIGLRGGQRVRTGESLKELLIANDLAYMIKNAVA